MALVRKPAGQDPVKAPYRLELEYEHKDLGSKDGMGTMSKGKGGSSSEEDWESLEKEGDSCP